MQDAAVSGRAAPLGLTLRALQKIVGHFGGRIALVGKTTAWVKQNCVKPLNTQHALSVAESLQRRLLHTAGDDLELAPGDVGLATVFVSHTYGDEFLQVFDAVSSWEARQPVAAGPFRYYIDLLAVNQFASFAVVPFDVLVEELAATLTSISRTVLVLRWNQPEALQKAWVMFEVALTRARGLPFDVTMPPDDEASFSRALLEDFDGLVLKTCNIRSDMAVAREHSDMINIRAFIRQQTREHIGLDQLIIGAMKQWMISRCRALIVETVDGVPAKVMLMCNTGRLLNDHGKPVEAEAMLRRALDLGRATLPAGHDHLQSCLLGLVKLLQARGRLGEAEAFCDEALTTAEPFGLDDRRSLSAATAKTSLMQAQGKLDDAERLCRDALRRYTATTGLHSLEAISCQTQLAGILQLRGDLAMAEALFRDAAVRSRRALAVEHPLALAADAGVVGALLAREQIPDAAPLCEELLVSRRRVLGDTHPDTLTTIATSASIHRALGHADAAGRLYAEAKEGRHAVLADQHPDTIIGLLEYAHFLQAQRRAEEAVPLVETASTALGAVLADADAARTFMAALAHSHRLSDPARIVAAAAVGAAAPAAPAAHAAAVGSAGAAPDAPAAGGAGAAAESVARPAARGGKRGLTLAALRAIVDIAGGEAVLADKSTDWVKYNVVRPYSLLEAGPVPRTVTMADALLMKERVELSEIQPANIFVSHAYSNNFLQMVTTLGAWETKQPPGSGPFYYYVDLMLVDAHDRPGRPQLSFEELRDEFSEGVRCARRLLLLLDWPVMEPLTRLWCIFEIATAMEVGSDFQAIVMSGEQAAFDEALLRDFRATLAVTNAKDADKAEATKKEDKINIRRLVEEGHPGPDGGFVRINRFVASAIRAWLTERFLWAMQRRLRGEA